MSAPIVTFAEDVYVFVSPLPILYVPLVAFLSPNVSSSVSVVKFPPSFEIVGTGVSITGPALYTAATPPLPISPVSVPLLTLNSLPVT